MSGLNLESKLADKSDVIDEPPPKMALAKEKVIEEARKVLETEGVKKGLSIVVIGMLVCQL